MSSHLFHVQRHIIPCQHIREYPNAVKNKQEDVLHLEVKQYSPWDNIQPQVGDVTIIAAHGNGFPKELYEPLWDDILSRSKKSDFKVRAIWIADISHQGASGVLNENLQGDDPSWLDHARDLLHMVNNFRGEMPRPIVGIGHSMGGSALVNLSILHPRLLSTLVLFDPIMEEPLPQAVVLAHHSTLRQDIWPSWEEAEAAFRKSKFYRKWDSRVLERWLQYGLREVPTALYPSLSSTPEGAVTLTTSKHQEAWSYARPCFDVQVQDDVLSNNRVLYPDLDISALRTHPFYRPESNLTLSSLPMVRPSVLYVFAQQSFMSSPSIQDEKMALTGSGIGGSGGAKEGQVEKVVLSGVSHLLTMEAVITCAEVATNWLNRRLKQFKSEEQEAQQQRGRKSEQGMLIASAEWKKRTREWMERSMATKQKL